MYLYIVLLTIFILLILAIKRLDSGVMIYPHDKYDENNKIKPLGLSESELVSESVLEPSLQISPDSESVSTNGGCIKTGCNDNICNIKPLISSCKYTCKDGCLIKYTDCIKTKDGCSYSAKNGYSECMDMCKLPVS